MSQELIKEFYKAFDQRDAKGMNKHYHADASFSDPVFVDLDAKRTKAMWTMICGRGKDLRVNLVSLQANGDSGEAVLEATYTFSQTGRKVVNRVSSNFQFKDGKIYQQKDDFDFYKWTKMAIGPLGFLLGWSPSFQKKLQSKTSGVLDDYIKKHNL